MKSTIHHFLTGKSNHNCKIGVTLFGALLISIFTTAQVNYYFDPGDNYGDGTMNLIGERRYDWNTNTLTWVNKDSFNLKYNTINLVTVRNFFQYDTAAGGAWKNKEVSTMEYDINKQLTVQVDTSSNPAIGHRYEFTYNGNNREIQKLDKLWNSGTSSWKNYLRYSTTYNAFDSVNVYLTESWNMSNTWQNSLRYVHTYNSQKLDSLVAIEQWNLGSGVWGGYVQNFYTYDTNGNNTSYVRKVWVNHLSAFRNELRSDYGYDGSNKLISYAPADWDTATNGWKNTYRYSYSYNAQGLLENELTEKYNTNSGEWDFGSYVTHTYDVNNRPTVILSQKRENNLWENLSRITYTRNANGYRTRYLWEFWNTNTLAWVNSSAMDYWYATKTSTGIEEQQQDALYVFPNPSANNVVFVNADKILAYEVYDLTGRTVTQGTLQLGTNSIIVNEAKGIYLLKAGNAVMRIVKE